MCVNKHQHSSSHCCTSMRQCVLIRCPPCRPRPHDCTGLQPAPKRRSTRNYCTGRNLRCGLGSGAGISAKQVHAGADLQALVQLQQSHRSWGTCLSENACLRSCRAYADLHRPGQVQQPPCMHTCHFLVLDHAHDVRPSAPKEDQCPRDDKCS